MSQKNEFKPIKRGVKFCKICDTLTEHYWYRLWGIVSIVLMSLFSWQCQNLCWLSLAFIIDRRVVTGLGFVIQIKNFLQSNGKGEKVCQCPCLLHSSKVHPSWHHYIFLFEWWPPQLVNSATWLHHSPSDKKHASQKSIPLELNTTRYLAL